MSTNVHTRTGFLVLETVYLTRPGMTSCTGYSLILKYSTVRTRIWITFPYVPGFLNEITDKFYIGMLSMTPFQKAKKTPNLQCLHSARNKTYLKRRKWVFKLFLHQLQSEPETIGERGENRVFNPKREKMDEAINHDREGRHLKLSAWNGPHFLHSPVYSKMEIITALEFELWFPHFPTFCYYVKRKRSAWIGEMFLASKFRLRVHDEDTRYER